MRLVENPDRDPDVPPPSRSFPSSRGFTCDLLAPELAIFSQSSPSQTGRECIDRPLSQRSDSR